MNAFDMVVILIVSFCLIRGIFRGLIGEVSAIIAVIAGFYAAFTYYPMITGYAVKWIQSSGLRNIAAFFVLFCAVVICVNLVSMLIHKLLNLIFLGWVDRIFGLVFGAAKGVLVVCVLFIMMTTFIPKSSNIFSHSKLSPYIAQISKTMTVFVSGKDRARFLKRVRSIYRI